MKLRLLAATLAALSLTAGVALAQPAPARPAAAPAQQQYTAPDKATLSYALGYERGAMIARSGADIDGAAVARGLQDAIAKKEPTASAEKMGNALGYFEQKMEKDARLTTSSFTITQLRAAWNTLDCGCVCNTPHIRTDNPPKPRCTLAACKCPGHHQGYFYFRNRRDHPSRY